MSLRRGFTLIEVLVTIAILALILVTLLQFMGSTHQAWKSAATDPYAEAQNAFETVCKNLASATLEPYQDYVDARGAFAGGADFVPDHLARRSDLDFICGPGAGDEGLLRDTGRITSGSSVFFVAPQGYTQIYAHKGLGRLLNALGYFVEFGDHDAAPAFILAQNHSWRWRLKQVRQPAEALQVYGAGSSADWVRGLVQGDGTTAVLADNVIALLVVPERAAHDSGERLTADFRYDSRDASDALTRNQLPPRLRVVLAAIDEPSAQFLENRYGPNAPPLVAPELFQEAAQLDADLASLDTTLTQKKIGHRIFQREIGVASAAWTNLASP